MNTRLEVNVNGSTIKIKADDTFEREYEFDGCKLRSHTSPRTSRWFGSLGLSDVGSAPFFSFFVPGACKGISRTVVEENQLHFDDIKFIYQWLADKKELANGSYNTVWNSEGLAVFWKAVPGRAELSVDVVLLCLNGQPAKNLEGAIDTAITWHPNEQGQTIRHCNPVDKNVARETRRQIQGFWKSTELMFEQARKREERYKAAKESKEKQETGQDMKMAE
ncbi:hypothetical protein [Undibacterium pigrum]|nr:hypothetical protein [Undibacterium pigrum]